MSLTLFRKRTLWWPTWLGWTILLVAFSLPFVEWTLYGERFLAVTDRVDAEVLVVEAWIGREAMMGVKSEFDRGAYRYILAAGPYEGEGWVDRRWSYPELVAKELRRLGVPSEQILLAPSAPTETQRTFAAACGAREALVAHGLKDARVNVFSRGPHARRSRSVFQKVLGPRTRVGVIASSAEDLEVTRWWNSSERAKELITETAGYFYELLLDSGRRGRGCGKQASPRPSVAGNEG